MKCHNCKSQFPNRVKIDGITKNLNGRRYCLKCSPFGMHNRRRLEAFRDPRLTWDKYAFSEAVKTSLTVSEVLRKIGLKTTGGNWRTVKKYASILGIDTSHFLGRKACYGLRHDKKPDKEVFCENSNVSRGTVRSRLLSLLKYQCAGCGIKGVYNGKPLVLQVEHRNGISNDHRLKNLEWLCPNCHSQTSTFAGKSKGRDCGDMGR